MSETTKKISASEVVADEPGRILGGIGHHLERLTAPLDERVGVAGGGGIHLHHRAEQTFGQVILGGGPDVTVLTLACRSVTRKAR